ncbi:MAG: hypothetical protein JO144_10790 [Actinobacteria bacterium]|nr:hypothetical protein [Actinomycetota bacterium]
MVDPRSGQVPTIAELVRQKLATGLTLRQLEERSGGAVPYQTFGKISKGEVKGWPKSREVIEGTASALGVDPREVVLGYATQFEIDVAEDRSLLASMLPASTALLTVEQAQAVANLLRVFAPQVEAPREPAEQLSALDISSFTTAERRQVTDLVLELGERARGARVDSQIALASVLTYLQGVLAAAIGDQPPGDQQP